MVYFRRTPGAKSDQIRRWNLPDRAFFAAGACHILAFAFLERFPDGDGKAIWLKPLDGSPTNHIIVLTGDYSFDYLGFVGREKRLEHFRRRALSRYPGWRCELVALPAEVLISEVKSKTYQGLWLREPQQFAHDAMPRATRFLDRIKIPADLRPLYPTT